MNFHENIKNECKNHGGMLTKLLLSHSLNALGYLTQFQRNAMT